MKKIVVTITILFLATGCNSSNTVDGTGTANQVNPTQSVKISNDADRIQCLNIAQVTYSYKISNYHQTHPQIEAINPGWIQPEIQQEYSTEFQQDKDTCLAKYPINQ